MSQFPRQEESGAPDAGIYRGSPRPLKVGSLSASSLRQALYFIDAGEVPMDG